MSTSQLEIKLQKDLVDVMKSYNSEKTSAIRSIKTAIQTEKTAGSFHDLTDDEIIKIIQKLSKQRQESAEIYKQAGRSDYAEKELKEKQYLDIYLPAMLSEDELKTIIINLISEDPTLNNMGKIMGVLKAKYPNRYNGATTAEIIKTLSY